MGRCLSSLLQAKWRYGNHGGYSRFRRVATSDAAARASGQQDSHGPWGNPCAHGVVHLATPGFPGEVPAPQTARRSSVTLCTRALRRSTPCSLRQSMCTMARPSREGMGTLRFCGSCNVHPVSSGTWYAPDTPAASGAAGCLAKTLTGAAPAGMAADAWGAGRAYRRLSRDVRSLQCQKSESATVSRPRPRALTPAWAEPMPWSSAIGAVNDASIASSTK